MVVLLVNQPEVDRKAMQMIISEEFRLMVGCDSDYAGQSHHFLWAVCIIVDWKRSTVLF